MGISETKIVKAEAGAHYSQERLTAFFFPIVCSLMIPILLGLSVPVLGRYVFRFYRALAWVMTGIAILRFFRDWIIKRRCLFDSVFHSLGLVPPGLVAGTDLKRNRFPWATLFLVMANTFVCFTTPPILVRAGVFPPYGDPGVFENLICLFTSAFLHGNGKHLVGNMTFLCIFGSAVEPRIGAKRFLSVYVLCIITSNALVSFLLHREAAASFRDNFHGLGASGAISGIMGLFAVRCFFARITFCLPFLPIPFLSVRTKINGTVLICLFFAMDISGSAAMFGHRAGRTNYWAHVGGYLGGFLMGYVFRLDRKAAKEALETKASRLSKKPFSKMETIAWYQYILRDDPDNESALRYMFEHCRSVNHEKAKAYYTRLAEVLVRSDIPKAVELYASGFPEFAIHLDGKILYRLGAHYQHMCDFDNTWQCFQMAAEKEGPWQAKAIFSLARVFEDAGLWQRAQMQYVAITENFPDSPFQKAAIAQLKSMNRKKWPPFSNSENLISRI